MPCLARVIFGAKLWGFGTICSAEVSSFLQLSSARATWLQAIANLLQVTLFSSGMRIVPVRLSGAIIFILNIVCKCVKPSALLPAAFTAAGDMHKYTSRQIFRCIERERCETSDNEWDRKGWKMSF